jgi:Tol biopolymer transport system component
MIRTRIHNGIRTNARLALICVVLTGLASAVGPLGCSSAPKPYTAQSAPAVPPQPVSMTGDGEKQSAEDVIASPLTQIGDNFLPSFSPDGKRILFISERREGHVQAQAYEIDIAKRIERRITFHDGDVNSVGYFPDGQRILYSSSTDEIKEDPYFINQLRRKFAPAAASDSSRAAGSDADADSPTGGMKRVAGTLEPLESVPSELYLSRLDGSEIRRLTQSPGFDGHSTLMPNGRVLAFVSTASGKHDLYTMNPDGGGKRRLTSDPERELGPAFSADGRRLAWVRLAADLSTSQIVVADGPRWTASALPLKTAMHAAPAWHPNGQELIFSSNHGDGKTFDVYSFDTKSQCLKRLTESESDELFPTLSPDGLKIAFSSNHSGHFHIYSMDYRPGASCLPKP